MSEQFPQEQARRWAPPRDPPPDITGAGFHVGTSGYYFDDWLGRFNPPRVTGRARERLSPAERADQDRLRFYQKYFSFVEINNTFYREPLRSYFMDIEGRSKERMVYAVKVHKDISHTRQPEGEKGKELMARHVAAVGPLVETGRFFSFLIQLDDRVYRTPEFLDYLLATASVAVKQRLDVHIEFRHRSWHQRYTLQRLKDHGVGICNTDIPPLPHAFPLKAYATTDKGYVRYSGRNLRNWYPPRGAKRTARERLASRNARYDYFYSEEDVRRHTADQRALASKTSSVAIAYNNHYQTQAVQNALENIRMLSEKLRRETNEP